MELKSLISTLICSSLFLAASAYAKPTSCQFGQPCTLKNGQSATYEVNDTTGVNFKCDVTAATGEILGFNLHGSGQYIITAGAGTHEANPTVSIDVKGKFRKAEKPKPKNKGKLMFSDIGGNGSATCTAVA